VETALIIIQILISMILSLLIFFQARSGGLGSAFGGGSAIIKTRRGVDKLMFNTTIVVAFLFLFISLINVAIK